ncbi:MAG TPA: NYN domain-containing protein [Candidatus Limnocylindrales bacterium]|nr:NYN domain-containing protein [Candidatus Limnocylindrales bacterium]
MSKNVAVFVDVANIFYAAKAANVDIDYVTLLKSAVAGRDFVRAYAYTGLDPENENQRNFHQFLARHGYKVVSKDIRKYGDGKVKANLDIELVVDMMKTARNLDVAIVVSGDGDFAPAIRAVQEMGVRVEVISFRGNTSSDLIDVADVFTDITHIAKVEKGSRSGRRVAGDEEDLSMTEVPEKQTEGPARPRSRRGGRGRATEKEVAASGGRTTTRAAEERNGAGGTAVPLTVLPGEKLSGASARHEDAGALAAFGEGDAAHEDELAEAAVSGSGENGDEDGPRRRRRRRGGRGRGRGRGTDAGLVAGTADESEAEGEDLEALAPPPAARTSSFGSVWDSQLGVPSAAPRAAGPAATPFDEEEDFEEPEIPEYLIAERRRGQAGAGRGRPQQGRARGGRNAAYAAAVERERFGGRGGGTRFAEPPRTRPQQPAPRREPRRDSRPQGARPQRSSEPWSEVPPELEEMLRSQLTGRPEPGRPEPGRPERAERTPAARPSTSEAPVETAAAAAAGTEESRAPARRRPTGRRAAAPAEQAGPSEQPAPEDAAPKRRTRRSTKAADAATTDTGGDVGASVEGAPSTDSVVSEAAPKRRTTRTTRTRSSSAPSEAEPAAAAETPSATGDADAPAEPAAKPRTRRRSTTATE